MQAFIYDEYGIVVSISTISRALKRAKISRKKVRVSEVENLIFSFKDALYSKTRNSGMNGECE